MNQMLEYAGAMKEAFDIEDKGLTAEEPRNRAEWARMMSAEITRQATARAEQIAQTNGEAPLPDGTLLHDTMAVPDLIAVDAWKERSQLLLQYGGDVAAMAQDASASIKAENSLEKMMAHEMAVAHKLVMELIGRARGRSDPDAEIKRLNLATRFMTVFQQGMLTLKKIRQGGQQKITVQYVNVGDGGQAVIGDVERKKR